ncbi:MAG: glycosyl transferase, group 2 family protein [Parcubacteria group bacterium Gr01-1014_2]|nr:MAG: glycosyl transferase, group 2 family protein [Parcubacteria group bacterium Gr01-1014_2]
MKSFIIIPTYNEKGNIAFLIHSIFEHCPDVSILVVDDNSPDGTAQVIKNLQNKFPRLALHQRFKEKGFGKSYLDGFRKVINDDQYEAIVMMDADFSHDHKEVPAMVEKLSEYDAVIGSRYVQGGKIENWNLRRRFLSRFANFYTRTILGSSIHDLTAGFMCFHKEILKTIDLDFINSEGYAFLVELKYQILKKGYKIHEHPIVFNERREGQSKMSFKNIWEAIWLPWKLKISK